MSSYLGPTLAYIFLCYPESNWLKDYPKHFKPVYYKSMWMIFLFYLINQNMSNFFLEYLNKKHNNMKSSTETKINQSLFFLDVKIFRKNGKFVIFVFKKETVSGVYTNFISFIPLDYEFGLVHSLLNRYFHLCSDFLKFHHEVDKLKKIMSKKACP